MDEVGELNETSPQNRLSTLDIFAGCGGLSEGLQHSGNFHLSAYCSCNGWGLNFCLKVLFFQVSQIQIGQLNTKRLLEMHLDLIIQRQRCSYIIAM